LKAATFNARAETVETNSSARRYPTVGSKKSTCPICRQSTIQPRCAGNNLDKAREVFAAAIKHRPRIRPTIRQRTHIATGCKC
jgi:hypothetical protein